MEIENTKFWGTIIFSIMIGAIIQELIEYQSLFDLKSLIGPVTLIPLAIVLTLSVIEKFNFKRKLAIIGTSIGSFLLFFLIFSILISFVISLTGHTGEPGAEIILLLFVPIPIIMGLLFGLYFSYFLVPTKDIKILKRRFVINTIIIGIILLFLISALMNYVSYQSFTYNIIYGLGDFLISFGMPTFLVRFLYFGLFFFIIGLISWLIWRNNQNQKTT